MNYLNELDSLMKEINFASSKILRSISSRGYFIILGKYRNLDVVLRTAPITDLAKTIRFKREHEASKILASFNSNSKISVVNFTKVIDVQESRSLCWSIRSYSKDQTLAIDERYLQDELHGYDVIRRKFIDNYQPIVENIINTVLSVQKIDGNIIDKDVSNKLFTPRLDRSLEKIDIKKIERILEIKIKNSIDFYNHNIDEYCDNCNTCANMGDLIPPNIIVGPDNQITLYDYEWFCLDNYMVDFSSLWLFLWRYPKWQKALNSVIITSDKDKKFFRMSLVRELISWFGGAFSINETKKLHHRVNFYKNHVWSRYLEAAGESFNTIMKARN